MMRSTVVAIIVAAQLLIIAAACKDKSKLAATIATAQPATQVAEDSDSEVTEITEEQDLRIHEKAALILKSMEQSLAASSDEQLIAMLHGIKTADGLAGFLDYYVAKDGNQMIEAALRKRGLAARAALKAHEDDPRRIYTEGPKAQMVAALCCDILTASKPPEAAARDRQLIIAAYHGDLPGAGLRVDLFFSRVRLPTR